eukprot:TRINITY_DN18609_c0_g2_i1.p1 TRINITY_DN18609_c0_g2~~TRINITY_DN18609_c0_g2_i1.p1  ORF type:complete len:448 (+),score=122.92 TRINITY_DN18609_c0_g2_i1:82-1425(+)
MSALVRGATVACTPRGASALSDQRRTYRITCKTSRSYRFKTGRLKNEWYTRSPYEPFSWAGRWGPDKGFFHRDNSGHMAPTSNPWGFLYPGGKVQSPLWQSDPGIGAHEVAGHVSDFDKDSAAALHKSQHNHPELTWDTEPTPFGQYDYDFSHRTGVIGVKVGKTTQIDDYGNIMNATIVWLPEQHIIDHFTKEGDGFSAVTVGAHNAAFDPEHPKQKGSILAQQCIEVGVPPKDVSKSFPVSEDAYVPIGQKLDARHFVPGQLLTVTSRTTERGFQGVVKRWGFEGGPTRYGPLRSKAWHRRVGSLSSGETWGMIPKGKKMPGHMGGLLRTHGTNWLWRVDFKNQLLYILGTVPGPMGQYITIQDSQARRFDYFFGAPPFPTFVPREDEDTSVMSWEECQLVSRSRVGFPMAVQQMPAPEVLDTYNFAKKQKELLATELLEMQQRS